jgi:hypothetical protein
MSPVQRALLHQGLIAARAAGARVVQRRADRDTGLDSGEVQRRAAAGVSGGGGPLPYLDTLQRAFGGHDLSGVRAHTAPDAATAIGARAYTLGENVAFRGAADLHTAAHEAAHVVQQRSGVSVPGGVGQAGDSYERHADAVADAVVAGGSAEGLLGAPGATLGQGAVQTLQRKLDEKTIDGVFRAVRLTAPRRTENEMERGQFGSPDWLRSRLRNFGLLVLGALALSGLWYLLGPKPDPDELLLASLFDKPFAIPEDRLTRGRAGGYLPFGHGPEGKLARYRSCLNDSVRGVRPEVRRYLAWAGTGSIPAGVPSNYQPRRLPGLQSCRAHLDETIASRPALGELDELARSFGRALEPLARELAWAETYYGDRETWALDGMAAGREHHPALLSAWEAFRSVDDRFRLAVDRFQQTHRQKALELLQERAPDSLAHVALREAVAARALAAAVAQPRPEGLADLRAAFLAAHDAAQAFAFDHPEQADELTTWSVVSEHARDFRKAAQHPAREELLKAYNDMAEWTHELMLPLPGAEP